MLKFTPNGWLKWGVGDLVAMSKILGAEAAVTCKAPYNPAIVRLAVQKGIVPSPLVEHEFRRDRRLHERAQKLALLKDAEPENRHERRYRPHQRADLDFMRVMRMPSYLLAHRVGAGKTLEAIRWAIDIEQAQRILVITLNAAKLQWKDEIRRWGLGGPKKIVVVQGSKAVQEKLAQTERGWVLAHWESLVYARKGYLAEPWDAIIADECHMAQNTHAQRTKTLLNLDAEGRIALTAHPFASEHVEEFYSILRFLYPDMYSSKWRFFHMHVKAHPKAFGGFEIEGPRRPKLLQWEIAPFTLRRTTGLGMPKITRLARYATLTPHGRKEYDRLRKQFFAELDAHKGETKILAIPSVLARYMRLRQYLIDPGLLGAREKSVKYPIIGDLIEAAGVPTVIFTEFAKAAFRLQQYLLPVRGRARYTGVRRVEVISGRASNEEKHRTKLAFAKGKVDVAIIVMKAGGASLNFGGFGHAIFLDLPWRTRTLEQAEGRVDRPMEGSGRVVPTTAYRVLVEDSYEQKMQSKLVHGFDAFSKVFTVHDLKQLFS